MSKANNSRRKKLIYNVLNSNLSAADKMTCYAMAYKYVDGEQLLEYIQTQSPTKEQIVEYIEEKLRENRVNHDGKKEATR